LNVGVRHPLLHVCPLEMLENVHFEKKQKAFVFLTTAGVWIVLLSQMELCGSRLGQKFDTTDSCISIAQTL
jgi:hypothetical protein